MGNKSSQSLASFYINQQVYPTHPKFNKPQKQVAITKSEDQSLLTILPINNTEQMQQWQQKLQKLKLIQQQYILLPKSYQFQKKSICGQAGDLIIAYDNYPYLLQQEIMNRSPLSKHLQQQEMWYLLYTIISGSVQFYNCFSQKIGDIQPKNIFINDSGQIKISCQYSWPAQMSNYSKSLQKHCKTYLSPQQMQSLEKKYSQPLTNNEVSQSFSIGLTLLQVGLLIIDILTPLYSFGSLVNFNFENLQKIKQSLKHLKYFSEQKDTELTYSSQLIETIEKMLQIIPQKRLSARQVYQWLNPHQIDIINLKRIDPGNPPKVKPRRSRSSRFGSNFKQHEARPKSTNIHIQSKIPHKKILVKRPHSISLNNKCKKHKQKYCQVDPINICSNQQKIQPTTKSSQQRQSYEKNSNPPVSQFTYYHSRLHSPGNLQKQVQHYRYPSPPVTFQYRNKQTETIKKSNNGTQQYSPQMKPFYQQSTKMTINLTVNKPNVAQYPLVSNPITKPFLSNNIHQISSIKKPESVLIIEPQTPNWNKFRSRQQKVIFKNQECDYLANFSIPFEDDDKAFHQMPPNYK